MHGPSLFIVKIPAGKIKVFLSFLHCGTPFPAKQDIAQNPEKHRTKKALRRAGQQSAWVYEAEDKNGKSKRRESSRGPPHR